MKPTKTALIIEGGGLRGVFPAGVLDAFLAADFDPFDIYIAVSSGVLNLGSYLGRQPGRTYRTFSQLATQPEFISLRKFLRGGHYMDLDWVWEKEPEPLDLDTAIETIRGKEMLLTVTNVETGQAAYIHPKPEQWYDYAKASSALPLLYRGFVEINGRLWCDGGVADPLPVQEAYRRGARTIVVLRTRPLSCVKKRGVGNLIIPPLFRQYPHLRQAMRTQFERYMSAVNWMANPPADCHIIQIAPSQHMRTTRTTQDPEILKPDYDLGVIYGEIALGKLSMANHKLSIVNETPSTTQHSPPTNH